MTTNAVFRREPLLLSAPLLVKAEAVKLQRRPTGLRIIIAVSAARLVMGILFWHVRMLCPERMAAGKFPEQLVYVRSNDDS